MWTIVLADWEIKGKGSWKNIDQKWFRKIITKVLINVRFQLNKLIDSKASKPPKVTNEQRNTLVAIRASEVSKRKLEQM